MQGEETMHEKLHPNWLEKLRSAKGFAQIETSSSFSSRNKAKIEDEPSVSARSWKNILKTEENTRNKKKDKARVMTLQNGFRSPKEEKIISSAQSGEKHWLDDANETLAVLFGMREGDGSSSRKRRRKQENPRLLNAQICCSLVRENNADGSDPSHFRQCRTCEDNGDEGFGINSKRKRASEEVETGGASSCDDDRDAADVEYNNGTQATIGPQCKDQAIHKDIQSVAISRDAFASKATKTFTGGLRNCSNGEISDRRKDFNGIEDSDSEQIIKQGKTGEIYRVGFGRRKGPPRRSGSGSSSCNVADLFSTTTGPKCTNKSGMKPVVSIQILNTHERQLSIMMIKCIAAIIEHAFGLIINKGLVVTIRPCIFELSSLLRIVTSSLLRLEES